MLLERLEQLGQSPDEIYRAMRALGIKGWPGYPDACVLARLLRRWIRRFRLEVDVESKRKGCVVIFDGANRVVEAIPLSRPWAEFVWRFDREEYPQLISQRYYRYYGVRKRSF